MRSLRILYSGLPAVCHKAEVALRLQSYYAKAANLEYRPCSVLLSGREKAMLNVNNTEYPFREGMTIKTLMDEKGFVFHRIIVKVNGVLIDDQNYAGTILNDGDNVEAIHIFAGG